MNSGNTTKYLKYAVGEILLVVVGILIALQINNWNEGRKLKDKEAVFLNEILSELDLAIKTTTAEIENARNMGRDSMINTYAYIITRLERKLPYKSSMARQFFILHQLPGFFPKQSGYESLKSSGMDIIENDSLRSQIGEYYSVTVIETQMAYRELRDDFYNYMLQFPRTLFHTKANEEIQGIQVPINYEKLCENVEYIESLKMFAGIYAYNTEKTKAYLDKTKHLKNRIENYLNHPK